MSTPFDLAWTEEAIKQYKNLRANPSKNKRLKAVAKALQYLKANPRHKSLNTHKYESLQGKNGEDVFEAYAENQTPQAYRIFWHYGPNKTDDNGKTVRHVITIISITPHP